MRRRLAAFGVLAAALVAGAAVSVGFGLRTGFDRASRDADLPDVIARFSPQSRDKVAERVRGLPNLESASYRYEVDHVPIWFHHRGTRSGRIEVMLGGRRGYGVVEGRDVRRPGEIVVERGVADELRLSVGDRLDVGRAGELPVVGIATAPDNVAYPLARTARLWTLADGRDDVDINSALLWVRDRSRTPITLASARTVAFGLGDLRFITRTGVRVTVDRAAGIVIALLVAFALVALVASGTMLAAGAHAEVQRALPGVGVRRALGFTPGAVVAGHVRAALIVAAPVGALGVALGALAVSGPARALLEALNQSPPGWALVLPLAAAWLVVCGVVAAAAALPAWRAARRPIAPLLRGGELTPRRSSARGGGLVGMGARFALAARARWAGSVLTIGVCAGIVLLMLALASLLLRLRDDPAVLGKRYQLTVDARAGLLPTLRAIPGVQAATQRYEIQAADAFRLGEPVKLVAYRGDHTRFDAPALSAGRRIRTRGEAEVGEGLADALGLRVGSPLATLDPAGRELRLKVVGVVRALDSGGRVAWVSERTLPDAGFGQSVLRLDPGADRAAVVRRLRALDLPPTRVSGATTRNRQFLATLASVLRAVALLVGLVCLYALIQGLAMTARERRGALAVLRAVGGGRGDVASVLAGAAAVVAIPAAITAIGLERAVFGPVVAHLASGYASLPLEPGGLQMAAIAAGLVVLAAIAAALVARRLAAEPVVRGLREET